MPAKQPILCYVTDGSVLGGADVLLDQIRAAARAGVDWIQIREKAMPARKLLELVRAAVADSRSESAAVARIIVNDRLDVAVSARAAGVHLGSTSLPVAEVVAWLGRESQRLELPPDFLVGRSCHSLMEAQQAERDGASYAIFGPVFATPSKLRFGEPLGVRRLAEACRALRIPVIAIGGLTAENAADCIRSGAAGIAAIRLFQESSDLDAIVRRLREAR